MSNAEKIKYIKIALKCEGLQCIAVSVVSDATLARKKKGFMPKGVRERKYVFSPPFGVTDDID